MPKLFVIMPFGVKRHDGAEYDFDDVYQSVIRPIGHAAGWDVLRIDEISAPGTISDQYLNQLLTADLVLADISIPNANVYYELGIRHSVSTAGTVLISSSTPENVPFDLRGQRIIFFTRSKADALEQSLSLALSEFRAEVITSPLRPLFQRAGILVDPKRGFGELELDIVARMARARSSDQLIALWKWLEPMSPLPVLQLRDLAERLSDCGEWLYAVAVLRRAVELQPDDFEVNRRLGWFLQKRGDEYDSEALAAYERALSINPNDPETLGLMGSREKQRRNFLAASNYYSRGATLSPNNLYMLVNQAAMKILISPSAPGEGLLLYRSLRKRIDRMDGSDEWTEILKGESCFALADFDAAELAYRHAATLASSPKPLRSGADQLEMFASVAFQTTQAKRLSALLRDLAGELVKGSDATVVRAEFNKLDALPVIIHLSDLHFGSKVAGGESLHRFFEGENSESLSQHLCEEFNRTNGHFRIAHDRLYLVISGDFGYRAVKQEFTDAKNCLDRVCEGLTISKERVILIPGNHDVNWTLSQDDLSQRFEHFLRFIFDFYGLDLCKKKYPLIDWPLGYDKKHAQGHDIISIHHDESHDIMFLGLNSCVYESHQDHFGFVGAKQVKLAKKLVENSNVSRSTVRIAVVHHHLHPFPERLDQRVPSETWQDLSTIRDAGFVESALESLGIDFVLHGHKHKPQFRETIVRDSTDLDTTKRLIVCGAGSVSCTELEDEEQNHYQVIELKRAERIRDVDFARLEWRSLSRKSGAEWMSTKAWNIRG